MILEIKTSSNKKVYRLGQFQEEEEEELFMHLNEVVVTGNCFRPRGTFILLSDDI